MKIKITVFLFLLSAIQVFSQTETTSFTLKQAIEQAQKNNYSIINANRDLELAKQKKMGNHYNGIASIKRFCKLSKHL